MLVAAPVGKSSKDPVPLHARPASLENQVLGLASNGKPNAGLLLRTLHREISALVPGLGLLEMDKTVSGLGSGDPAPPMMIEGLSTGAIAVLAASGD